MRGWLMTVTGIITMTKPYEVYFYPPNTLKEVDILSGRQML